MVNRDKSGLIFSKFVQKPKERELKSVMQMKKLKEDTVYLGAPLFLTNNRSTDFKFLQDKLEARLKGWRSKNLSWAGRSTTIKSVAQALPTYTMSTFELPKKICDNLDAQMRRFWWNPKSQGGRYVAWKALEQLCQPKEKGGLGFR